MLSRIPLQTATWHLPRFVGGCLLIGLIAGCAQPDVSQFNPDLIDPPAATKLEILADTSSYHQTLGSFSNDAQRVDSLIYAAEWLKDHHTRIAQHYAETASKIALDHNWQLINSYWQFSRAISSYLTAELKAKQARFGEDLEGALVDARTSKRLLRELNRDDWKVRINGLIGHIFSKQNKLDSAQFYFAQALDHVGLISDDSTVVMKQKAILLHDLLNTYSRENVFKIVALYEELEVLYKDIGSPRDKIKLLQNKANFYLLNGQYSKADSLYILCYAFAKTSEDHNMRKQILQERGYMNNNLYINTGNSDYFNEALQDLRESLVYSDSLNYYSYQLLGASFHYDYYFKDQAGLDPKDMGDSALIYYKKALEVAREQGSFTVIQNIGADVLRLCADSIVNCEAILGNYPMDFINQNYAAILDTITQHSETAFITLNEITQQDTIASGKRRQNSIIFGSVFILAVSALTFLILYQRQQNKRLMAQMEALRAQINPHFISNSLNAIESLINLDQSKAATKYLIHFSRLTRQILSGSRTALTSLENELSTLKHFLALEELRFKDKLSYEFRVDDSLPTEIIEVPALILQPYVENAIWHGLKPKAEGGTIWIDCVKEGKILRCSIEDNGIGREKAMELKQASILKQKSMGMQITQERLRSMGKVKGSNVEIEDLYDATGNASGTRVNIRLPYRLKKSKRS